MAPSQWAWHAPDVISTKQCSAKTRRSSINSTACMLLILTTLIGVVNSSNTSVGADGPMMDLAFQKRLLARDAPAPSTGAAVGAHHAMARHDEGELVAAAGVADGARGLGFADRARDVGVTARFTRGDARQCLPHAPLERGRGDVDGWKFAVR